MITIKNRKMIMGTLSAASVLANSLFAAPVALAAEQPSVDAKAAFVIEDETDKVLVNQNGEEALGIASMTKMLSIYLILEAIEAGKLTWDKQITVSDYVYEVSQNYNFSNVPLRQDITYSVEELYQSALIYSANGSTIALAEALAGSEAKFVDLMKAQLDEWGVESYELYNATGLSNSDVAEENLYPG
ncbi:MAG: serine hydrolase, partial [Trichococcus flocculiformis]